jgi:hypothetical protein
VFTEPLLRNGGLFIRLLHSNGCLAKGLYVTALLASHAFTRIPFQSCTLPYDKSGFTFSAISNKTHTQIVYHKPSPPLHGIQDVTFPQQYHQTKKKTKLHGFSPQGNYKYHQTQRKTARSFVTYYSYITMLHATSDFRLFFVFLLYRPVF